MNARIEVDANGRWYVIVDGKRVDMGIIGDGKLSWRD